jgi:hypothetical protein
VYTGITCEKWTEYKPIRLKFEGIISIDLFNRANKGKFVIHDSDGELKFLVNKDPTRVVKSDKGNMQFPYKRVVTCPHYGKQLHASSSRGKLGKYYPAYHCRREGHNFRVPLQEFEDTISAYVRSLQVNTAYLEDFTDAIRKEWERRSKATVSETDVIDEQIKNLAYEARQSMDKIKFLNSETAIKYIEEELVRIEGQIEQLKYQKTTLKVKQPVEIEDLIRYAKFFFEHLDILLLQQSNPIAKANFFQPDFQHNSRFFSIKNSNTRK